jgi:hypothetical protein
LSGASAASPVMILTCITPPQPIAIDEDNTTEHAPVINARHTMALRKIRPEPRHLSFAQPVKIAHNPPSVRGA